MTNGNGSPNDIEEITLAIALLGGIIVLLLTISNFFYSNVIPSDSALRDIASSVLFILLLDFLIILLFFLFKGISIYTESESWGKKLAHELFKFSFIMTFVWIIAFILTFIFVYIFKLPNDPSISFLYNLLFVVLLVIVYFVLWDYNKFKSFLSNGINFSFGEFLRMHKKLFILIIAVIVLIFLLEFLASVFLSTSNLLTIYLLMGSYSIEEFLQPNDGNITIAIKETGTISAASYINLYYMDSDFEGIDAIRIAYHQVNFSENGFMVGTNNDYLRKIYLTINTSKLEHGNYLLHAEVTILENPILGTVKKQADKMFYIPPKSTNYSFNSTQELRNSLN